MTNFLIIGALFCFYLLMIHYYRKTTRVHIKMLEDIYKRGEELWKAELARLQEELDKANKEIEILSQRK